MLSFKKMGQACDYQLMAIRMLLIGTEQGTKLKELMKKVKMREIFAEKIDPTNKLFTDDYPSTLKISRTFKPLLMKCFAFSAVETIALLQKVAFFESDFDSQNETPQVLGHNFD